VHDRDFYLHLWARLQRTGAWEGEITNRRKDGSLYTEWLSISTVKTANGVLQNYIALFSDLTQKQALDRRVDELQNFDPLTGLPNRNLFIDRVQHSVRTASREKRGMAVFWVDIARFRVINDTFGHPIGDSVLTEVGQRLQRVVRAADSITRLSADEFGILMFGFDGESDIVVLAQRVIEAIGEPMQIGEHQFSLASHLGISVFPKDGETADDLLKAADAALVRAKQAGRDVFRFFTAGMDVDAARRLTVEVELRNALAANQFEMHYQPQIDLATGRLCGTEALIRWTHPVLGAISPTEFIPLAEEAQLIGPIGEWAMRVSCRQNKAWLDAGFQPLPVAVNVSGRQFHQPDLVEMIAGILAETALPHHLLEIELTETAFIGDMMAAVAIAHRIKGLGVLLALDDFGTGYSSLSYLKRLPLDQLKIDRSFVHDVLTDPNAAVIVRTIIALARSLGLAVIAEGVETAAQRDFLASSDCHDYQGYFFSKPLPIDEFDEFAAQRRGGR
jgi:diguanylate cyclase (GGDEF)-like protein